MKSAPTTTQEARLEAISELAPAFRARARAADDASSFPAENFADLRRLGLVALTAPESLGGHGLWSEGAFTPYYELIEALAWVDTCTAQLLQVHSHALGFLSRHGTPAQHERFVEEIVARGQLLASVGSETAPTGNQPGVYSSELVPDGDGWRLTCKKFFASLAPAADWLLLWVALPGPEPYTDRTVTVLLPRDAPEVTLVDDWDVMGMRPTVSWGVHVDDMYISPEHVIGRPGAWVRDDPRTFSLAFAANHAGLARAALDFAIDWVRARPYLADSDLVQNALGTLAAQVHAARSAVMAAARIWDAGRWEQAEMESLMAVHVAKGAALDTTRQAFDICGARTSFRMFPLETWYRDARTLTLHVRDDVQMRELGRGLIRGGSSVKAALDTSVLPPHNA
jgi:alkylation response protein AidB-like acyl-CoA dehydrogenase